MATEKRLIYADDALEQLKQAEKEMKVVTPLGCKAVDIKAVIKYLESRPTVDAVEVVRCKDCKWYNPRGGVAGQKTIICSYQPGDFFCAYGERK